MCSGLDAEPGEVVGHLLLVGVIARLYTALVQCVVVGEEEEEEVPEHTRVQEISLEPLVHSKGRDGLHSHAVQPGQVLGGGGEGGGERACLKNKLLHVVRVVHNFRQKRVDYSETNNSQINQTSLHTHNYSLEGATKLKFAPFCSS